MLELVVRLVFSLAVVIGLLLLLVKLSARRFRGSAGSLVQVLHRQPLSRTTSVAVVTIGERVLVLGATDQTITVLTELDPAELPEPVAVPALTGVSQYGAAVGVGSAALGHSVLSPQTWKQAYAAATSRFARVGAPVESGDRG